MTLGRKQDPMLPGRKRRLASHFLPSVILLAAMGCVSPAGPSSNPPPRIPTAPEASLVTLTVRVLTRTSELPIEDAMIDVTDTTGRTDETGICTFSVKPGVTADVNVSASGFR